MCTNNIVTEIRETFFENYTKQVSCPFALPLLNISHCQSVLKYLSLYIANCLYLHDRYITKFDFMNYAFAKLVVAWLYNVFKTFSQNTSIDLNWNMNFSNCRSVFSEK